MTVLFFRQGLLPYWPRTSNLIVAKIVWQLHQYQSTLPLQPITQETSQSTPPCDQVSVVSLPLAQPQFATNWSRTGEDSSAMKWRQKMKTVVFNNHQAHHVYFWLSEVSSLDTIDTLNMALSQIAGEEPFDPDTDWEHALADALAELLESWMSGYLDQFGLPNPLDLPLCQGSGAFILARLRPRHQMISSTKTVVLQARGKHTRCFLAARNQPLNQEGNRTGDYCDQHTAGR